MSRNKWLSRAALTGGALVIAASMSSAFAGIDLDLVGEQEGESFQMSFTAKSGSSDTAVSVAFNNIKVYVGSPTTFESTSAGQTISYTVSSPQDLEDSTAGNGNNDDASGDHDALTGFLHRNSSNTVLNTGWVQTNLQPTTTLGNYGQAAGGAFSPGDKLEFSLWFAGDFTNGSHFYVEFWNNNSFQTGYEFKRIDGGVYVGGASDGQSVPTTADGYQGYFKTNYTTPLVPLPPAVWSGLAVLGGLGFLMARRRRNQILA